MKKFLFSIALVLVAGRAIAQVAAVEENCHFIANGIAFTMVAVQGGTFEMGATNEQFDSGDKENPVQNVTLSDYYIGSVEVTQELWEAVMGNNPSTYKGWYLPVGNVSYNDCLTFINKLNKLLANKLPQGRKFRMPTEAEWEFAARGGNYSTGCYYSGSNSLDNVAWSYDNSGGEPQPVWEKDANELGIADMSGNILEWCSDWFGDYSSSAQTNPKGPSSGSKRVARGGSAWDENYERFSVAYRNAFTPDTKYPITGLRLAL